MKFKTITGGTEAEALAKFPWLVEADFQDAVVNIIDHYLVWKDGTWNDGVWEDGVWEGGVWKDGVWEGGVWKDGVWEDGIWKDGVWEGGLMWPNVSQDYESVTYENWEFTAID